MGDPRNLPRRATRAKRSIFFPISASYASHAYWACARVAWGEAMLCDDAIVETFCQCGEKDNCTVGHLRSVADRPDMVCRNCKRSFMGFRPKLMDVIENDGKYPFERLCLLPKVVVDP